MPVIRDRVNLSNARRLEDTPQGYLWCRDVPLARTGTMDYAPFEVPDIPPVLGQRTITVERTADEVFSPEAIASFRGMPLTDDHPDDFVTAENHREHRIGDIHDPRRGEGEHADCLVADLLVTDPEAIKLIKSRRKRELSCGYDAKYADVRPGYGRQVEIRGNHVSLVDAGRAGPRIAIRDRIMSSFASQSRSKRVGFTDTLRAIFRSTDDAERERQFRILDDAMDEPEASPEGSTVNVHVHAPEKGTDNPEPKPGDNPNPDEGKDMDEDKVNELIGTAIDAKLTPVMEAIKALSDKFDATSVKADEAGEKADAIAEALEDMTDPDDVGMEDAVLRADVLAPGLNRPARDSKPGSKSHRDGLVGFKRAALKQALTTDSGRSVIAAVAGHARVDIIDRASPDAIGVMFNAASQMMADRAASATALTASTLASATTGYVRDDKGARVRPMNTADLAQIHRDHYAKKTA